MKVRDTMLPVLGPKGGKEEIQALTEVIESGWWGKGPKVAEFEEKFAEMVGHKYACAVTSASHGQDLVMKALGFKDIDVINPAISFIATAMIPLWQENVTTNIVDVDPITMCIDPEDVKKHITPNTKAIIAVNQAGVPAPIEAIRKFYVDQHINLVLSTQDLFDTELLLRIEKSGEEFKEVPAKINEIRPSVSLIYKRIPRTLKNCVSRYFSS